MTKIIWDAAGSRFYETGIDRAVIYPISGGYAWNGLLSVAENVSGGEVESVYFDGAKYNDIVGGEDFQATISALSVPPEFNVSDGLVTLALGLQASQQPRARFGLSYRTKIGSDTNADLGYKLHIVYQCTAAPSEKVVTSQGAEVNPSTRDWVLSSIPIITGYSKPIAHLIVDSRTANAANLLVLENLLYGTVSLAPELQYPDNVISILNA